MKLASFALGGRPSYGIVKDGSIVDAGARLGATFPDLRAVIAANAIGQLEKTGRAVGSRPRPSRCSAAQAHRASGKNLVRRRQLSRPQSGIQRWLGSASIPQPVRSVSPDSLVAHEEQLVRPPESKLLDYEGEIVIVIGRRGRRIAEADALSHIAGYSIGNEGTIRDWLRHGKFNVTPGKNFERSGSFGPWIVTPDELGPAPLRILTRVNGEVRQDDTSDHMIFSIPFQVSYISRFCTLEPGDIVLPEPRPGRAHDQTRPGIWSPAMWSRWRCRASDGCEIASSTRERIPRMVTTGWQQHDGW